MITAKWNTTSANHLRVRMEVHALTVWEVIHALAAEVTRAIPANSRYVNIPGNENITKDKIDYHCCFVWIFRSVKCTGSSNAKRKVINLK